MRKACHGTAVTEALDLYFRAHTILVHPHDENPTYGKERHENLPENALIFRCAPTSDEKQDPLFGAYVCAQLEDGQYVTREIGVYYREGHPEELRVFERFVKNSAFELGTLEEFRRKVFLKYLKAGALLVAHNAPFEISRIAVKWNKSQKNVMRSHSISECSRTRKRARYGPAVTSLVFRLRASTLQKRIFA